MDRRHGTLLMDDKYKSRGNAEAPAALYFRPGNSDFSGDLPTAKGYKVKATLENDGADGIAERASLSSRLARFEAFRCPSPVIL